MRKSHPGRTEESLRTRVEYALPQWPSRVRVLLNSDVSTEGYCTQFRRVRRRLCRNRPADVSEA